MHAAGGVRDAASLLHRNHAADRVRNSATLDLTFHSRAHDRFLFGPWHPDLSTCRRARLEETLSAVTAGLVNLTATVAVVVPASGRLHALAARVVRALFNDGLVRAAADVDLLALYDRLANSVADFAVTSFGTRLVCRVALFAVAGLVNRLADVVTDGLVAGFVARLADRVALVAVACLSVRHSDCVLLVTVAGLLDRFANGVRHDSMADLIDRLLNRVALVAKLRLVDVLSAGDRLLFADRVINRSVLRHLTLVVDDVLHGLVTR